MQKFWLAIRCIIVLASAVGASLGPLYMPGQVRSDWLMPVAAFLLFPAVAVLGLVMLLVVSGSRLQFTLPSWHRNPFELSHPEQFFHLSAFVLLAQGLVLLVRQVVAGTEVGAGALTVLLAGCGVWVGLRMLRIGLHIQSRRVQGP